MFNFKSNSTRCKAIILLLIACPFAAVAGQAEEILKRADSYRLQSGSAKVISVVESYESGKLKKNHIYNVYVRPNRKSLVVFKAASEAGQKMLMLGDNYWLLMPNSRRPLRITPMQKLLGEASIGDISTLTWSEDYEGEVEEKVNLEQVAALKLNLKSKTAGASYHRIELWVEAESYFPIKANLYMKSGKLAKTATFSSKKDKGETRVAKMKLQDNIQKNKETVIFYESIEPQELPDKYYNPAYLSRQSVKHL